MPCMVHINTTRIVMSLHMILEAAEANYFNVQDQDLH